MSALAQRLAGLRQQAGLIDPTAKAGSLTMERNAALVASLRKLLDLRPKPLQAPAARAERVLPGSEIAPGLRYIEEWHPFYRLPDRLSLHGIDQGVISAERVLAFDTETTGLAGGTGTRAFMIGAADWRDGGLRVRQLLITTLSGETAMLREFSTWLRPDTVVLSYNGKSYDRPLLSTRYTLARMCDPLRECAHIDLLHAVRRRYKGIWENCRLITAERELLGVLREGDLPGAEAPGAWLAYLRGGSAEKLRRVGKHNADDLKSLWGILHRFQDDADPPIATERHRCVRVRQRLNCTVLDS